MSNNVGRPKNIDYSKENTYGYFYSRKAENKDSELSRTKRKLNDFRFDKISDLELSISTCLAHKIHNLPIGIIVKEFEPSDEYTIYNTFSVAKYDYNKIYTLSHIISSIFRDNVERYKTYYKVDSMKNIGFHVKINFNMIRYANNLSIIYQIINDIHYNFFNNHLACYILSSPEIPTDPLYTLDIYVCNTNKVKKSYLSTSMSYGFDQMKFHTTVITDKNINFYSRNGSCYPHTSVFKNDPSYDATPKKKPNGISYKNWYSEMLQNDNFGNTILTKIN